MGHCLGAACRKLVLLPDQVAINSATASRVAKDTMERKEKQTGEYLSIPEVYRREGCKEYPAKEFSS